VLVYVLPSTGIPWPVGIPIALAPIAAGVLLVRRMTAGGAAQGPDGLPVITGILRLPHPYPALARGMDQRIFAPVALVTDSGRRRAEAISTASAGVRREHPRPAAGIAGR